MPFPLATVLTAAPGIISAAADVIKLIRNRKPDDEVEQFGDDKVEELITVIEKQAVVIEELARNNNDLALAVRNNRIISIVSVIVSCAAIIFVLVK